MEKILRIFEAAIDQGASDIFIVPGTQIKFAIQGRTVSFGDAPLRAADTLELIREIYDQGASSTIDAVLRTGDDDFSVSVPNLGRFRCNIYKQRGSLAAVIRCVRFSLPDPRALRIPDVVMNLSEKRNGVILVTGATGCGKSTTLACLVDRINSEHEGHIVTLEDPIEFLHSHKKSIVSQREVAHDTESYTVGLRAALRESPRVILLGEMRDYETIRIAMTAAETGQLLLSSLHTIGAVSTIDRIIDVFPSDQQQQVRLQFALTVQAIVSQQLLPATDGTMVPAFEIMLANPAIRTLIREGKTHQLNNTILNGQKDGMTTMDADILRLYREDAITRETAMAYAFDPEQMARRLSM